MSYPNAIELLAIHTPNGTTERHVCPKCLGGITKESSLSLTRDDAGVLHWICFRASCGYKGGPRATRPLHAVKRVNEPRVYTHQLASLGPFQERIISERFPAINTGHIFYNTATYRFVLPILGPKIGQMRGYIAKSLSGETPKSLTYNERPAEPFIHFAYPKEKACVAVIVEDWFSAEACASAGYVGVCINGTNINQFIIDEVKELNKFVVFALDSDAFGKAVSYKNRFAEQFQVGCAVVKLDRDLKFETAEKIKEIINGVRKIAAGCDHKGQKSA